MRAANHYIEREPSWIETVPAVCDEAYAAKRASEVSAATFLPATKRVAKSVCAGSDFGTKLKRVQTVVVAGNAQRRHTKRSQRTSNPPSAQLRVPCEIPNEQK